MSDVTPAFRLAVATLFADLSHVGEANLDYLTPVCVEHAKFIPCRPCMYSEPAAIPYSVKPRDITAVRAIHAES